MRKLKFNPLYIECLTEYQLSLLGLMDYAPTAALTAQPPRLEIPRKSWKSRAKLKAVASLRL